MPDIVKENEGVLSIDYIGPMARAQKKVVVQSTMEWLGNLGQMSEAFPDVLDIPDMDKISRDTGLLSGVPIKYMNNIEEVTKLREARQKQLEEAQATARAQADGEAKEAQGKGDVALEEAGGNV